MHIPVNCAPGEALVLLPALWVLRKMEVSKRKSGEGLVSFIMCLEVG